MKKIGILFILLTVCCAFAYSAQVAYSCEGDVVLSSQEDVNAFNCTHVTGKLTVAGPEINNIDALSQLKIVGGLVIENTSICDVNSLGSLTEITSIISIRNNAKLQNLDGLSSVISVNAAMEISGNPILKTINGFSSLTTFGTALFFTISNNASLESIDGFQNVSTILGSQYANVTIENNPSLANLDGFKSLQQIYAASRGASLNILNNGSLTSIGGLTSLTSLRGDWGASLRIENNPSLKNLNGLNSLNDFGGGSGSIPIASISIVNNALLEDIDALSRLSVLYIGTFNVNVNGNALLKRCCGLYKIFNSMKELGILDIHLKNGFVKLSENGSECTVNDILAGGACTQIVCEENISLLTQADVDAFGCTEVTGSLTVNGSDITNLSGLSSLRSVGSNFSINAINAATLDGLSSLEYIGGELSISSNTALTNTDALNSLKSVGSLFISGNRNLTSLNGFDSLAEIKEGSLDIQFNQSLVSITGFSSLHSIPINRGLTIVNNENLESVNGFGKLMTSGNIAINSNPALIDLSEAFQSLDTVGGLSISMNNLLSDLDGFSSITKIRGLLDIRNNQNLKSIKGFKKLVKISEPVNDFFDTGISIADNTSLESFDGLSSLKEITGRRAHVAINNNPVLKNVDGLSALTAIEGVDRFLHIQTNLLLKNIDGLSALRPGPSSIPLYIVIRKNEQLTRCTGLLHYFEALGWELAEMQYNSRIINITDNGSACTIGDLINGGPVEPRCTGDVELYSQAKVDAFNCTEVNGSLTISGSDITNINTLSNLRKITGALRITNNPRLSSLEALSSLDTIGGELSISGNAALTDLSAFSSLRAILGQSFFIVNNPVLHGIDDFNSLTVSPSISIERNSGLESITGFNSLDSIHSVFNPQLAFISIQENQSLITLNGFRSIRRTGNVQINNNNRLLTIEGFLSLNSIVGYLEVNSNESLLSIEGFRELRQMIGFQRTQGAPVNAGLIIANNSSLTGFAGLSSLKYISGEQAEVGIANNPSLKDINGLSSLSFIDGEVSSSLRILNNASLQNIDGLAALRRSDGVLSLGVSQNLSLTRCTGIYPYFVSLGFDEVLRLSELGTINITNNGAGCTVEDIIASNIQLITEFTVIDERNGLLVKTFEGDSVTLDRNHPDFLHWALRAHTSPATVGSVLFNFDDELEVLTDETPYIASLSFLDTGAHTVVADVFSEPFRGGEQGIGKSAIIVVESRAIECQASNLTGIPDATSVKLHWTPYSGPERLIEYKVKRNGVDVGSTVGKYAYFTDTGLTADSTYAYSIEVLGDSGVICESNIINVTTASQTTIRTHYNLLAIVFDPGSQSQSELAHIRTFLDYRVDFLKNASHNSVNLDIYQDDIITIDAHPPLVPNSTNIDYAALALTSFPELGNNTMVDLIEKYAIDIVWVLGSPAGHDFGENVLMGNKNLGADTWGSTKVKCSRSFFIHSNSGDARAFDAAAHHIEGMMTSATEGSPDNWPRDKEFLVYRANRNDFSMYTTTLHLWGRFRLTDEWNGVYGTEGHMSNAYASKGNSSCGSSHFVPGSIRNSTTYDDYTYYDVEAWKRYVDSYADDWLSYPNFSDKSRKLNGYDFGAFNKYEENGLSSTFGFGTASFHYWWFNHIPHNPGVSNGKLNNWWPYLYDSDRFDGSVIQYEVDGFPVVPVTYSTANNEYGTEEITPEHNWMFWHTNTDFGQRADLSVISRATNPEYVKSGQSATRVHVQVESFGINGRNDLVYPRYRNAHWNLSNIDTITFSVKFDTQYLLAGTNPIFRLCTNGNNRIEFVPKKAGLYTNLFKDAAFQESDGWYTFRIPVSGSTLWENNIIGYIDPNLSAAEHQQAKQALIQKILRDVNYFEISVQSDGGRGESLVYVVDNVKFHQRDTTYNPQFSKVTRFDVVDTSGKFLMELSEGSKINIKDPAFKLFSIRAHTNPEIVSSVKFWLNGQFFRVENVVPYAFNGDNNGVYNPWVVNPWDYTIKATSYIKAGGREYEGQSYEIHFKIVSEDIPRAVVSFDIVDTSGKFIKRLIEGDAVSKDQPMTIIANITGQVGSVRFDLNNQFYRTENVAPYTITGDQNGYFNPWIPQAGHYTLKATPYSGTNAGGQAGTSLRIHFTVADKNKTVAARSLSTFQDSIQLNEHPSVIVYPIPVDHELFVDIPGQDDSGAWITIFDTHGSRVYNARYFPSSSIDTRNFNPGLYFLQVSNSTGYLQRAKFIKK